MRRSPQCHSDESVLDPVQAQYEKDRERVKMLRGYQMKVFKIFKRDLDGYMNREGIEGYGLNKSKRTKLEVLYKGTEIHIIGIEKPVGMERNYPLILNPRGNEIKLWSKYKVTNVPTLIFIEGSTGRIVSRNGHLIIRDDPLGSEFPWGSKSFAEVMAGSLIKNNGQVVDNSALDGSYVGIYFSAHW
eukprot:g39147.t1